MVNDDEVASDVVQEAFVRVLQRHERYDPVRPFKAWFLQIVRNLPLMRFAAVVIKQVRTPSRV